MAKGSAMGLWKGKKGSSVFYQIKNSNSLQKQGVRERNYEPANPQTASQAGQRMRMFPAQAVYGAIKDVIERSWQGVKYGQMSRQEYLKHALREPLFPAVTKGDSVVVPGPYQISKGSLQEVAPTVGTGRFIFPIFCGETFSYGSTLAELSTGIINNNPFLQEGDQLSFVLCHTNLNGDGFYWNVISFYLNTQAQDITLDTIFDPIFSASEAGFNNEGISFISGNHIFMAAACVISREGDTPLRSTARLACDYTAGDMQKYYSAEAQSSARRSYMKQVSTLVTDWPSDPDSGDAGGGGSDTIRITATAFNEYGTVTGGGRYQRGDLVSLVANPEQGYVVQGWYTTEQDAEAGKNPISQAGVLTFTAGDSSAFGGATTFFCRFILQG